MCLLTEAGGRGGETGLSREGISTIDLACIWKERKEA